MSTMPRKKLPAEVRKSELVQAAEEAEQTFSEWALEVLLKAARRRRARS